MILIGFAILGVLFHWATWLVVLFVVLGVLLGR